MDLNTMEMLRRMAAGEPARPQYPKKKFIERDFLLNMQEEALCAHEVRTATNEFQFQLNNTTTTALQSSHNVDLTSENQITLSTVFKTIDKVHIGKFLICRTIAPPFKMCALATVVDEPCSKLAVRLSLYNFVPNVNCVPNERSLEILPVGTILLIKNPFYKTTMDGGMSLRCDNPGDVSILEEKELHKLMPNSKWLSDIPSKYKKFAKKVACDVENVMDWKRIGNEHFVAKRYVEAIKAYTSGLSLDPGNIDLLSNRAASNLNIGKFEVALSDAEEVLKVEPVHVKAIFRKCKALFGLKRFDLAQEFLKHKVLPIMPGEKSVKELVTKTSLFISQSKHGKYPVKEIADNKEILETLDWADYEGSVTVKITCDGRGRGMFATKRIPAGQLVLASKAFGFAIKDEKDMLLSSNLETKLVSDASQVQLVSQLAHSIRDNPDRGKRLYKLYAGPKLGHLDPEKDDCTVVDMKRIDGICTYNSFGHGSAFDFSSKRLCGMWIQPSFINHSCIDCNCFWTIHGDFLFVRAFKDIQENEEITISYIDPLNNFVEREKVLQKFGFMCSCSLCHSDRNETSEIKGEKEALLKKMKSLEITTNEDAKDMESRIRHLMERSTHNYFLVPALNKLCSYYYSQAGKLPKLLEYLEVSFSILKGTPLCSFAFRISVQMVRVMLEAGQKKKARKSILDMKKAAEVAYGSLDVLEAYPHLIEEIKLKGLRI